MTMDDGIVVPDDYLPSDARYLLEEWRPYELEIQSRVSNHIPSFSTITKKTPSTAAANTYGSSQKRKLNRNTRPAAFYDKHLAENLLLKHVKRLHSLVDSIVGTVDKAIKDAYKKGPLPPNETGSLSRPNQVKTLTIDQNTQVLGEAGVAEYYQELTVRFFLPIASTLALHPTHHEWASILSWTKEQNKAGYAISDGVLKLLPEPTARMVERSSSYQSIIDHVDPDIRKYLLALRERYKDIATWEMKSLTVGDLEVMNGILQLASKAAKFPWQRCKRKGACMNPEVHARYLKLAEGKQGFDALHPPWTLPLDDTTPPPPSPERRSKRLKTIPGPSSSTAGPFNVRAPLQPDSSLSSLSSSIGEPDVAADGRKKRKHRDMALPDKSQDAAAGTDAKGKSKAVVPPKRADDAKWSLRQSKKKNRSDESYEGKAGERGDVNAKSFLQQVSRRSGHRYFFLIQSTTQAWAQAVNTGSTLIILHSGNHEIIGVRHRATQTLYVSDLIEPHRCTPTPTYGKIHVGIYIAAILDGLDRVKQDMEAEATAAAAETASKDPDKGSDGKDDEHDDSPSNKRRKPSGPGKMAKKGPGRAATAQRKQCSGGGPQGRKVCVLAATSSAES
jgi:hypothetical protein